VVRRGRSLPGRSAGTRRACRGHRRACRLRRPRPSTRSARPRAPATRASRAGACGLRLAAGSQPSNRRSRPKRHWHRRDWRPRPGAWRTRPCGCAFRDRAARRPRTRGCLGGATRPPPQGPRARQGARHSTFPHASTPGAPSGTPRRNDSPLSASPLLLSYVSLRRARPAYGVHRGPLAPYRQLEPDGLKFERPDKKKRDGRYPVWVQSRPPPGYDSEAWGTSSQPLP
jgi:hypothetical protein